MKAIFFVFANDADSRKLIEECANAGTIEKEFINPFSEEGFKPANDYFVTALPTVVFVDEDGNELGRFERDALTVEAVKTACETGTLPEPPIVEEGSTDEIISDSGPGDQPTD